MNMDLWMAKALASLRRRWSLAEWNRVVYGYLPYLSHMAPEVWLGVVLQRANSR